jgi:hypothetical protein
LWDDSTYEVFVPHEFVPNPIMTHLSVDHCVVRNGTEGLFNEDNFNEINYLSGNIEDNPLLVSGGEPWGFPEEDSPCIDAGTAELPPGVVLSDTDILGNPRVYGSGIDIGCYEWNPDVILGNGTSVIPFSGLQLFNSPNPFNPSTTILYNLPLAGLVQVSVYNIRGQLVRSLLSDYQAAGEHEIEWDGTDNSQRVMPSGVYLCQVSVNGDQVIRKMSLLK